VIATNRPVSVALAGQIAEVFTEVVVAPGYDEGAVAILAAKKNIRLLEVGPPEATGVDRRSIDGGVLVQFRDRTDADHDRPSGWQLVAGAPLSAERLADLEFAWKAVRGVKSNAILLAHDQASVGIGMGQVNRVDSCRLAVQRAGDRVAGRWPPSDAFFPFADGPEILLAAGVSAIVQPGGSVRDAEVIAAVQAHGATMYFTGARHFFH
jgi:phosphoribosylaminoimidazolecarboxamide formyltransferase/IMP cyclohydrolase